MKLIKLTKGYFVKVDDEDYDELNKFMWQVKVGVPRTFYAVRTINVGNGKRSCMSMHRQIMGCSIGDGRMIDNKDRDGLNCQKSNLRFATFSQNSANKTAKKNGASKYVGVCWEEKRTYWKAQIRKDGKLKYLGYYAKEIDAARAYNKEAILLHGEFANLNIIP